MTKMSTNLALFTSVDLGASPRRETTVSVVPLQGGRGFRAIYEASPAALAEIQQYRELVRRSASGWTTRFRFNAEANRYEVEVVPADQLPRILLRDVEASATNRFLKKTPGRRHGLRSPKGPRRAHHREGDDR